MQVIKSNDSTFQVRTVVPAGATPTTDDGNLNWGQESDQQTDHPLSCGVKPNDDVSFQFYLGQASLGSVLYRITYTVTNTKPQDAQFCLGQTTATFTTKSGKDAPSATLPTGDKGFVGLLPMCKPDERGTFVACIVSKDRSGPDTVLSVQVPALKGDPWGRS